MIGGRPPGFYGSTYDELRLRKSLGVEIIPIEVSEVLAAYDRVPKRKRWKCAGRISGLGDAGSADDQDVARRRGCTLPCRLSQTMTDLSGIAVKCWPELKDRF